MRKYKDTDSNDEFLAWFPLLFQPSCQTTSELNYFLVAVAGVISDDQKLDVMVVLIPPSFFYLHGKS